MIKLILAILLPCVAVAALAQPAPAQRYVDAQGVEIIQNRDAPRQASADAPRVSTPRAGGGSVQAAVDPKLRISAAEQAERDLDRVAILREELGQETRKFEAATQALAKAEKAARGQPQADTILKQLKDMLHVHQQNIQAISLEMQRAQFAR